MNYQYPRSTKGKGPSAWLIVLGYIVAFVLIAALSLGIQYFRASGDVGCMFSTDPALCVTVKEMG